jgi:superfamily II DNA helicase RecQ
LFPSSLFLFFFAIIFVGHDFRPSYRKLSALKQEFSTVPTIALTATATTKVQKDVLQSLGITNAQTFRTSFNRPNIRYEVRFFELLKDPFLDMKTSIDALTKQLLGKSNPNNDLNNNDVKFQKISNQTTSSATTMPTSMGSSLDDLLFPTSKSTINTNGTTGISKYFAKKQQPQQQQTTTLSNATIQNITKSTNNNSPNHINTSNNNNNNNNNLTSICGIVYCHKRETCEEIAQRLQNNGFKAQAYHAGLSDVARTKILNDWSSNLTAIVVATIAFGMGINKSDVRFVIHYDTPKNLESFYQESGRAGRDGKPSLSLVYYSEQGANLAGFLINKSSKDQSLTDAALAGLQEVYLFDFLCLFFFYVYCYLFFFRGKDCELLYNSLM